MKQLIQSIGLALASLVVVLSLLEVGVRLFVPSSRWLFIDGPGDWRSDTTLGWANKPNLDVTSQTSFGPVRFRTNEDGLIPPDAAREKPEDAVRIMIFGDSMVVGRALNLEQIYTTKLQAALRARGIRADVVNAGVQGYSTDQDLLLMERLVPVYQPDFVLYGSTLNDYGGNPVDHAYGQPKPVFRIDDRGQLQLSLPEVASEIQGPRGLRQWLQYSALYRLVQPGIALLRAKWFGFREGILLGTEPGVYLTDSKANELDWRLYEALVARMQKVSEESGARFLLFAHPEVGEVWEPYIETACEKLGVPRSAYDPFAMEKRLRAFAAAQGIEFLPTVAPFREAPQRGPFHLLPMDAHLNASGHALLAELLTERIAADLAAGDRTPTRASGGSRGGTLRAVSTPPGSKKETQVAP